MTTNFEIPDAAVEAALNSTVVCHGVGSNWREVYAPADDHDEIFGEMRAALSAALPIILGKPVARVDENFSIGPFVHWIGPPSAIWDYVTLPLYAIKPSKEGE